jgi:hypothetical protein
MKKLSAASGLFFGVFLSLHMVNHFSLFLPGWVAARNLQKKFRVIYQHPVVEILFMLSLLLHLYSNTVLYFRRQKLASPKQEGRSVAGSAELTAHRLTGTFLALSIFGHVGATRIAPLFLLDDPSEYDYSFITSVTEEIPGYVFHVYLVLLGMAGGWHLIYGTRSALAILSGSSVVGKPFPVLLKGLALASHVGIILAVLVLSEEFYIIPEMNTKMELHKKFIAVLGI